MKKHLKKLSLLFAVAMVLIVSCSKEEAVGSIHQNGGEVFRSQVVTINLPNTNLSLKEYEATLDGRAITLSSSEDHKLLFLMPEDAVLGAHTLLIPDLNDATVTYNIKETVLDETPVKTLAPLFENLELFNQTLISSTSPEASNMQNNIKCFTNYYNKATDEEKTQLAIAYKANKSQFDQIVLNDYSTVQGRLIRKDKIILAKFLIAVASIDVGSWLAVSGGHPGVRALGIVIAGIATASAIDYYIQFIKEEVKEIGVSVGSILGIKERGNLINSLSLKSDITSSFAISTLRRKLNSSDSNATQPLLISFFKSKSAYNYVINKVNKAILYVNANSFFTFGTFQLAELPATTISNLNIANEETFGNITFTVSHPNLKLVSSSLGSDGQLNLKIKIKSTPASLPIESFLIYSYKDDFNSFSGKLPIQVEMVSIDEVVIGTQVWKTRDLNVTTYRNGDVIPQVEDDTQWKNLTTGAWCYYENNTANGTTYGKLYNWYAITDPRGLAPVGWRIPNDTEWTTLTDYLGGQSVSGGKMKSTGSEWERPNTAATNSSGFSALPGGYRTNYGSWGAIGFSGKWWSSSALTSEAWIRELKNDESYVYRYSEPKAYGCLVRCVKD